MPASGPRPNLHVLAAGQPDSLELAREYMRHTVGDRTPAAMQDTFLKSAAAVIAWLETKSVRFSYMTGYPDYRPDLPGALLTGRAITPKVFPHKRLGEVPAPVRPKLAMGHGGPPITDPGPEGPEWGGQSLIAQLLIACERTVSTCGRRRRSPTSSSWTDGSSACALCATAKR